MMELFDVMIRLGDAREMSFHDTLSGKRSFEKTFGSNKDKFPKRKYKAIEEPDERCSDKPITPQSEVKRPTWVEAEDATKKKLCFSYGKAGYITRVYREGVSGGGEVELNSITILSPEKQTEKLHTTSIKESMSTFKRKHRVLESLS